MLQITGWTVGPSALHKEALKFPASNCFQVRPSTLRWAIFFSRHLVKLMERSPESSRSTESTACFLGISGMFWHFGIATWHARNQQLALEGHVFQSPSPRAFPPKRPGPTETVLATHCFSQVATEHPAFRNRGFSHQNQEQHLHLKRGFIMIHPLLSVFVAGYPPVYAPVYGWSLAMLTHC